MDIDTTVRVEIEYVPAQKFRTKGSNPIFVRNIDGVEFNLTPESTIAGCPLLRRDLAPRAIHADGTVRRDIITLILKDRRDLSKLTMGQEVWIEKVQRIEKQTFEVI